MKFKIIFILAALALMLPTTARATIDYGAVNHLTRQFTYLNDGALYCPIGWKAVGEKNSENLFVYGQGLGYAYTDFPYLIESTIVIFVLLIAGLSWLILFRKKRAFKNFRMNIWIIATGFFFLTTLAACAGQDTLVHGELIWTAEQQTITDCESGKVYWVRVLVSNHHFRLSQQFYELAQKGKGEIIVEFQGTVKRGTPSLGPTYPVDGTLIVDQTISIEQGSCER